MKLQLFVDKETSKKAEGVCKKLGFTLPIVISGCLSAIVREQGIPYTLKTTSNLHAVRDFKKSSVKLQPTVETRVATQARAICEELGFTLSTVVNGCLSAMVREQTIPYNANSVMLANDLHKIKQDEKEKSRQERNDKIFQKYVKENLDCLYKSKPDEKLNCPKCGSPMRKNEENGCWCCHNRNTDTFDDICGKILVYDVEKFNDYISSQRPKENKNDIICKCGATMKPKDNKTWTCSKCHQQVTHYWQTDYASML